MNKIMLYKKTAAALFIAAIMMFTACSPKSPLSDGIRTDDIPTETVTVSASPVSTAPPITTPAPFIFATPNIEPRMTPAPDTEENILKVGITGISGNFNPLTASDDCDRYICSLIFESLVTLTEQGEFAPGNICAGYTVSADKLCYTFELKPGIRFADGSRLTARDVAFTYMTIAHPECSGDTTNSVRGLLGYDEYRAGKSSEFAGINVLDELRISFTFKPGYESSANLGCFITGIIPKTYYKFEEWSDFLTLCGKPKGSGMFMLDSLEPNAQAFLKRNNYYWDSENGAIIAGIRFLKLEGDELIQALINGNIDMADLPSDRKTTEALACEDNISVVRFPSNSYTFMQFNCARNKLSDVRVRQALTYALDRKGFIEKQYGGEYAILGLTPISPSSWVWANSGDGSLKLNPYDFDTGKSASLLDEAGWKLADDGYRYKDGEKLVLDWLICHDSGWSEELSNMAKETWANLGIGLIIESVSFDDVLSLTVSPEPRKKDFDIFTMGALLPVDPDQTGGLFDYMAYGTGGINASGYYNSLSQKLIRDGRLAFDTIRRTKIYKEWCELMNSEIPTLIIAYGTRQWAYNSRVHGLEGVGTYVDWTMIINDIFFEAKDQGVIQKTRSPQIPN